CGECHHTVLRAAHHEPERKNCAELVRRRPEPRRHRRLLRLLFVALIVASGGREHLREVRVHAPKPRTSRIAATGACRPVQSSKLAAPCATSTSSPSRTRAPAAAAASAVAVRGYGRSTSVCSSRNSKRTSSRTGVAWITRPASRTSGGHSPR